MTGELQFLLLTALCSMAFIVFISTKSNKQEPPQEPKTQSRRKTKHDEIIDTLDWMLVNNIITQSEYTKLMGKCLQYM